MSKVQSVTCTGIDMELGLAIFQCIYHAPGTNLGAIRYSMFSRKAAAGTIKPEALPPTEGAAAQHSLRAYLQTRDWLLLQSMSLDPTGQYELMVMSRFQLGLSLICHYFYQFCFLAMLENFTYFARNHVLPIVKMYLI